MVIRSIVAGVVASALMLSSVPAIAAPPPPDPKVEPTADDIEEARQIFANGEDLYNEGRYAAAIQAFRQAFALSGEPSCLYNISLMYEKQEDYQGAIEYREYFRAYAKDSDLGALEQEIRELENKLEEQEKEKAIAEVLDEGDDDDDDFGYEDPDPTPIDTGPQLPRPPIFTRGAIVATVFAGIGFGVGTALGVVSLRRKNEAEAACDEDPDGDRFCGGPAMQPLDDSKRFALGADIAFGVGAVSAVAAVIIISVNAAKGRKNRLVLSPARRGAALTLRF